MRKSLLEKYFDSYRTDLIGAFERKHPFTFEVFTNPSISELQKDIPIGARAYADERGNLYVASSAELLHIEVLEALKVKKFGTVVDAFQEMLGEILSTGACLVRTDEMEFQLAESYLDEDIIENRPQIEEFFERVKLKNPNIILLAKAPPLYKSKKKK